MIMTREKKVYLLLPVVCLLLSTAVATADNKEKEPIMDPAAAGPDWKSQGEYVGKLSVDSGGQPWGAQVIALGDGAFRMVGYEGGLPGAGWQRGDRQEVAEGKRQAQGIRFDAAQWFANLNDGRIRVFTLDGTDLGTLTKTERKSPTLGAAAPPDALVLFDGTSADKFEHGQLVLKDLLLAGCWSKQKFGDHKLHLEFRTPFKPHARGQARGNSGVYLQSRYEVQVLDSFGLAGENNECGGIYKIARPAVNMCFPPLAWQTYDIDFSAARYDHGKKVRNAHITVSHNGVKILDNLELPHETPGRLKEADSPEPLFLQGHGNPVVYRNIWAVSQTK